MKNNRPITPLIRQQLIWPAVLLLALIANLSQAAASVTQTRARCLSCHSIDTGVDSGTDSPTADFPGPQLGGFSEKYIAEQLKNFQSGLRGAGNPSANAMSKAAAELTEREIRDLAKWASSHNSQKLLNYQAGITSPGAQLYAEKCRGCHNSFMGRTMTGSPRIDYLNADYIARQLQLFRHDFRTFSNPTKHQTKMLSVVKALSKAQLNQLITFVSDISPANGNEALE